MGSHAPPIPREQQSRLGGSSPASRDAEISRDPSRDQSSVNLKERGASANLRQNLTPQRRTQDR